MKAATVCVAVVDRVRLPCWVSRDTISLWLDIIVATTTNPDQWRESYRCFRGVILYEEGEVTFGSKLSLRCRFTLDYNSFV